MTAGGNDCLAEGQPWSIGQFLPLDRGGNPLHLLGINQAK